MHSDLDDLVKLARRERPAVGALSAVARRLRVPFVAAPVASIVPSTAMAAVAAKVGLSRVALLGWGAGSAVAVSGLALGVALSRPAAPPPALIAPPVIEAAASRAPLEPGPAVPERIDAAPAPEVAAVPSPKLRAAKEAPTPWDEPQLIERARKALGSDPGRALSLTREHQRRFPNGALGVEREVIGLEALAGSGQTAEAKRRALAFEAQYPKSIYLPRVRALLARL